MKGLLSLVLFYFLPLLLSAQRDDGLRFITNASPTVEPFNERQYFRNQKLAFREIVVIDERYDTTKIGYTNNNQYKIQLGNSWTAILNNYFKNNLDKSSDKTLVVVIRSFWMQRGLLDWLKDSKIALKSTDRRTEESMVKLDKGGVCYAKLDVYSKSDSFYQALFYIDTSFINASRNFRQGTLDEFFFAPFDSVANRLANINIPDLLSRKRKIPWKEINTYYQNRFNLPVLHNPVIKKGIFLSFTDFKNNNPYEADFRTKEGDITDELYLRKGQNEELLIDYWGFSDGKDLYIKAGFSFFKAIRQQLTFEVYGSKKVSIYHNNNGPGDIKLISAGSERKVLQINMDTGEFF